MEVPKAYRCLKCGRVSYPKHARCPGCGHREFEEFEVRGTGRVLTYTKLYAVPRGVDRIPLPLCIVEFEGGVKMTGQLTGEAEIGSKVRPVWRRLRKVRGRDVYGFAFEPVEA